jgi:hypothetical protein
LVFWGVNAAASLPGYRSFAVVWERQVFTESERLDAVAKTCEDVTRNASPKDERQWLD